MKNPWSKESIEKRNLQSKLNYEKFKPERNKLISIYTKLGINEDLIEVSLVPCCIYSHSRKCLVSSLDCNYPNTLELVGNELTYKNNEMINCLSSDKIDVNKANNSNKIIITLSSNTKYHYRIITKEDTKNFLK